MRMRSLNAVAACILAVGCENMSNTQRDAGVGGLVGAGAGALIGNANGHRAAGGALIGGAVGALAGGLVGSDKDKSEKAIVQQQRDAAVAQAARPPLGITDVASLAAQGMGDTVIINQIRTTNSVYHLSASDLTYLKQNGVSDAVISEMQQTAARARPVVVRRRPVYVEQPVYVERPVYMAPPPVVGVGFYGRFR